MRDVSSSETITGNFTMMFLSFERFQLNKPKRPPLVQAASVRAFNGVETMKLHYLNILVPFCIVGIVALGIVALERDGFILFRFGEGEMVIDGR